MALSKRKRRELQKNGVLDESTAVPQRGMNLNNIVPKTLTQEVTFEAYESGNHLLLHGIAGTGKTFISLYLALDQLFNNNFDSKYNNITIIRSVVPTRDIGFLPGRENEKIGVYEDPYRCICNELFQRGDAYDILKYKDLVRFMSTSFVRGLTLRDTIVIVDEVNNMTFHELDSLITRMGENCRIIFCGDFRQSDLKKTEERTGLMDFMKVIDRIDGFTHVEFTKDDIVRSKLVKDYIIAREELEL